MTPSEQPFDNPYASPSLEMDEVDNREPRAAGVTGPVLHASGKLTLDDGRNINRLTSVGLVRQIIVFAVLAVALLALFSFSRHDPAAIVSLDALPVLGIIVLLMGGFLLLSHLGPSWQMRRQHQQSTGIFQPQQFQFSADCMFIKTGLVETRVKWKAFSHVTRNKDFVMVYLAPPTSFFVVPKSFFESPHDWESFVELVERNVKNSRVR